MHPPYHGNRRQTLPAILIPRKSDFHQLLHHRESDHHHQHSDHHHQESDHHHLLYSDHEHHSSLVSLLESGSLSSIPGEQTGNTKQKSKFHTLDEKTVEVDDIGKDLDEDDKESVKDMQLLSAKLENLSFHQDLALFRSARFGGKSPTRNFIKNFP